MTDSLTYPERVAIARLRALLEILPTALDHELAAAGITSFEYTILESLTEADDHFLRLTALAAKTNATLPRLSRVITSLEKKGLVERRTCPSDRRANNAFLTDAGRECFEGATPAYQEAVRRFILTGVSEFSLDGVNDLAGMSLAMLRHIDPDRKLAVTHEESDTIPCHADPVSPCAADPSPRHPQDSSSVCAADPAPAPASPCHADPVPECSADPSPAMR